jgi:hypothetical protein
MGLRKIEIIVTASREQNWHVIYATALIATLHKEKCDDECNNTVLTSHNIPFEDGE